jgi:hypothetical protein
MSAVSAALVPVGSGAGAPGFAPMIIYLVKE